MASRIWSLRSWMAAFWPPPSRMMVSSLLIVTFLAVPSMAGSTLSRLSPTSSLITWSNRSPYKKRASKQL